MMRKQSGFTLLELLIVVAIIAILVVIAIPVFSSSQEKARATVCLSNRRSLYAVATTAYMMGEYDTFEDAFLGVYDSANSSFVCPSGGTFTLSDSGNGVKQIVCSVHSDSGSGSAPEGPGSESGEPESSSTPRPTYGSTNLVIQDNYWPDESDFEFSYSSVTITAGGIFQYTDGSYYVVAKTQSGVMKQYALSGPGGDLVTWDVSVKLTGRIVTYSSTNEQKNDIRKGDICQVGDDYYVYNRGGSQTGPQWARGPMSEEASSGYKIPNG